MSGRKRADVWGSLLVDSLSDAGDDKTNFCSAGVSVEGRTAGTAGMLLGALAGFSFPFW